MSTPITPVPTPILDAALKHAEAIEQARRDELAADELASTAGAASSMNGPGKESAAGTSKSAQDDKEPVRSPGVVEHSNTLALMRAVGLDV
jgi:hypothetical protein